MSERIEIQRYDSLPETVTVGHPKGMGCDRVGAHPLLECALWLARPPELSTGTEKRGERG